ncbi:chromate efflux transporter [Phenylobacterium sp.]|uniref:chromate efflux transporter n=1 Tax=Phenylobacterium sp. TaxID=1871053 RepID=UPI002DF1118F|nr:chromate efflux transporter [Phenylobacterium sp.]
MSAAQPVDDAASAGDVREVFLAFLRQGLTAFGGPIAHLGYFRREFVEKRGWLSEAAFADLLGLAQFLPGPASSQLGMAIGLRRAGYAGMLAAWIGFTLPAAAAMLAFAYLAPHVSQTWGEGWLHGLKIAAAAVVIQALVAMARTLAVGPIRAGMAIGAGLGVLIAHGSGSAPQVFALAAGGLFGLAWLRDEPWTPPKDAATHAVPREVSVGALAVFGLLLAALPFAATLLQSPTLGLASVFYRTGSLVFGGGHVVLPLLERDIVGRGWLDQDTFLAGYGAVQALPGPLFSFAGFVGAAQDYAPGGLLGGLVALVAIFLPSLLLILGVLPFWDRLKTYPQARGALAGVNAVVVGLLAAALWQPVLTSTVQRPTDWALVAAAWVFLAIARLPPWLVVIGFAVATGLWTRVSI